MLLLRLTHVALRAEMDIETDILVKGYCVARARVYG
jgi:hypothetical protein